MKRFFLLLVMNFTINISHCYDNFTLFDNNKILEILKMEYPTLQSGGSQSYFADIEYTNNNIPTIDLLLCVSYYNKQNITNESSFEEYIKNEFGINEKPTISTPYLRFIKTDDRNHLIVLSKTHIFNIFSTDRKDKKILNIINKLKKK